MHILKPHFAGKSHVIWDWNGTLLDDSALCVGIISEMLEQHGLPTVDMTEYRRLFRFPVIDYYRDVGFDFERTPFEVIAKQFIDSYNARCREAPLFDGADELLAELRAEGLGCSVLSAAVEADLKNLLLHHGIDRHFTQVFGLGDHFARSKVERGKQLIKELGLPLHELLLVGDTDHDFEVGDSLGIEVLLVEGGHQSGERLRARHHRVSSRDQGLTEGD